GWIKRTEIPPEYSRWGSFNQLIEHNNDALHAIAEKAAKTKADPKTAPEMQKVGDYYASGMDEKTIEAMRTKPLQDELGKIDNMKERQDVLKEIAHLHLIGVNAFFGFASGQDSRTRVELRDPQKNYNKMTPAELQALTPDWNWGDYFKETGLTVPGDIDVHQPDFFKAVNTAFTSTSIDDWKTYLRWHLINGAAPALSSDFVNEDFNFKEKTLRGTEKIKPRW